MNNKVGAALSVVSGASVVVGEISTAEMLQIVSLVIAIIAGILSILFTIYNWYKKAIADGKVTVKEVGELAEQVAPLVENVGNKVEETKDALKEGK